MLKQSWLRPATMPMDAYRHDNHLVINFDVPGVDAESIEVTVENNTLKVVSPRPRPTGEGIQWLAAERPHGTSTCQLYLGDGVDIDALVANCDDSVLAITIPVIEQASRRIEIGGGEKATESIEAPAAA
jgi:HSP20 family protein